MPACAQPSLSSICNTVTSRGPVRSGHQYQLHNDTVCPVDLCVNRACPIKSCVNRARPIWPGAIYGRNILEYSALIG